MTLEKKTFEFIISTIENPQVISEENTRLVNEKKELEGILCIRNLKIRDLEQQPEIKHIWRKTNTIKKASFQVDDSHEDKNEKEADPREDNDDIKDLQRLAQLKLSGHSREAPQNQSQAKALPKVQGDQKRFICNKCDINHNSSEELENHIDSHFEDGDFSCDTCLFQSNRLKLLKNHILNSPGHSSGQVRGKSALKCNLCDKKFIDKKELINHKNIHHTTYKPCVYFKDGKCKSNPCRFSHKILKEGNCVCFDCGKDFTHKSLLMQHRKSEHKTEACKKFLKNECDRDSSCWFEHVKSVAMSPKKKMPDRDSSNNTSEKENLEPQGFWKTPMKLAPPDNIVSTEILMKSIEERVQRTMEMFMEQMRKRV